MTYTNTEACEICEIIPKIPGSLIIDQDEFWVANLAFQDQSSLGRTYIALKRHAAELDELTEQEEASLLTMRNGIIRAIREQFHPITFNISCLKNDAFKQSPDTNPASAAHVHWHIVPRYNSEPTAFAGVTFQDPSPGRYLALERTRKPVSEELAAKITTTIRDRYLK